MSSECVGQPYDFNPKIAAKIVVATSPTSASGFEIAPRQEVNCRQKLPNRQHHCVFAMEPAPIQVDLAALGCPADGCYVNLVMDAWHKRGSPKRNVILIGANNKNGKIKQDKGRLNAIRTRPGQPERRSAAAADGHRRRRHRRADDQRAVAQPRGRPR